MGYDWRKREARMNSLPLLSELFVAGLRAAFRPLG
jgi:hypothetical protein